MANRDRYDTTNLSQAIATVERSAGNESVGDMWIETSTFPLTAPLKDVIDWAKKKQCSGRLILTLNEASEAVTEKVEE